MSTKGLTQAEWGWGSWPLRVALALLATLASPGCAGVESAPQSAHTTSATSTPSASAIAAPPQPAARDFVLAIGDIPSSGLFIGVDQEQSKLTYADYVRWCCASSERARAELQNLGWQAWHLREFHPLAQDRPDAVRIASSATLYSSGTGAVADMKWWAAAFDANIDKGIRRLSTATLGDETHAFEQTAAQTDGQQVRHVHVVFRLGRSTHYVSVVARSRGVGAEPQAQLAVRLATAQFDSAKRRLV